MSLENDSASAYPPPQTVILNLNLCSKYFWWIAKFGEDTFNHAKLLHAEGFQYGSLTLNFDLDVSKVNTQVVGPQWLID